MLATSPPDSKGPDKPTGLWPCLGGHSLQCLLTGRRLLPMSECLGWPSVCWVELASNRPCHRLVTPARGYPLLKKCIRIKKSHFSQVWVIAIVEVCLYGLPLSDTMVG